MLRFVTFAVKDKKMWLKGLLDIQKSAKKILVKLM